MENKFIKIVEDYLENRKLKTGLTDLNFRNRLEKLGLEKEKISDLILKMDDEWTKEQYAYLELRKSKKGVFFGYSAAIIGLLIIVISYFAYEGRIVVIMYGAVFSGILSVYWNRAKTFGINKKLELRKIEWKSWIS
jgi:hypothetical protein